MSTSGEPVPSYRPNVELRLGKFYSWDAADGEDYVASLTVEWNDPEDIGRDILAEIGEPGEEGAFLLCIHHYAEAHSDDARPFPKKGWGLFMPPEHAKALRDYLTFMLERVP